MPKNTQGYKAITKKAKELGWPIYYQNDLLVHDHDTLYQKDAPQVFGWGIREMGTDLYPPNNVISIQWAEAKRKNALGDRYFWYNGTTLEEVTLEELITHLVQTLDVTFYEGAYQKARMAELSAQRQVREWAYETTGAWYQAQRETEQARKNLEYAEKIFKEYASEEEELSLR